MKSNISFKFIFNLFKEDNYDVERITVALGITPSKKWIRDKTNLKPLYRDSSCWSLMSDDTFSYDFSEAFKGFYDQLFMSSTKIKALMEKDNLYSSLDVVVAIHNGNIMPGIGLTTDEISLLNFLRCPIGFDIYDFRH